MYSEPEELSHKRSEMMSECEYQRKHLMSNYDIKNKVTV